MLQAPSGAGEAQFNTPVEVKRTHFGLAASLVLGVLLGALEACGSSGGGSSRHAVVDSRDQYDPRSLDPALSTDVPTGRAVGYVFDGLTRFEPDARVEPALAERWDVSTDGTVYTFHLRRGVTFHDGSPFTARNVVASWTRALDPATKSGAAQFLYPIKGAREVNAGTAKTVSGLTARDDHTLVVTLTEPLAIFTKMLAMPVAAVVPERMAPNFGEAPIGTGPWKLVEWKHDDYLLFAKNASYFAGAPKVDTLRARIIAEPSTGVAEFESGNVDILQIPETEARDWQEDESRSPLLMSVPALQLIYVGINTTRGPLADVRVRQAINYAVDVDLIIERLISGRGTRAAGVVPPALAGYDSARKGYTYDPAKAKQLLAIDLWTSTRPIFLRVAENIQAYLGKSGIRAKIIQRESAAARGAARKGETDMILKDWYADYPDAEGFLYPLLHSASKGAGGNVSFYASKVFDSVVTASRRENDDAKRNQLYRTADSIAFHDAPMLFLYFYNDLYAVQPWLKEFRPPVIFNGQRWTSVSIDTTRR
jgi:oligopeptide transport system substrate-binding protein